MSYRTWGADIDDASHAQMAKAMELPVAVAGALMPDAHLGYGLPIGGVLALDNAVCPYAVGVDIACRMKMSIWELIPESMDYDYLSHILKNSTFFGVGQENAYGYTHQVFNHPDWDRIHTLMENKAKAIRQLGTSGSGNHFAEFGCLEVFDDSPDGMPAKATYLALMTHSGSRGTGGRLSVTTTARPPRRCGRSSATSPTSNSIRASAKSIGTP